MKNKKIEMLFGFLLVLIFIVSCSSNALVNVDKGRELASNDPGWKNLKVLPKTISEEELKGMMKNFNTSLGVKCNFCHASNASGELDFASDAVKNKDIARGMITMTFELNKKYFGISLDKEVPKVTCFTCHQGNTEPQSQPTS